jgi:DNA polymerase III epsilon subunit family exonuclease
MAENVTGDLFPERPADSPLESTRFAVLDVETTGLDHQDRVIEVGCLLAVGPTEEEAFSTLVNPDRTIPEEVVAIHGIREEDVQQAPRFAEILPQLERMLAGSVLVAHNAPYDVGFLSREYASAGRRLSKLRVLDTLLLARNLLLKEHYSLDHLSQSLSLRNRPAHRALADVRTTQELLWKLIELAPSPPKTLQELLKLLVPPEVSWEEAERDGAIVPTLVPLKKGLELKAILRISYTGRSGEETYQDVMPERLERSAGRIYLRARVSGEREMRVFRLDRIGSVCPVDATNGPKE